MNTVGGNNHNPKVNLWENSYNNIILSMIDYKFTSVLDFLVNLFSKLGYNSNDNILIYAVSTEVDKVMFHYVLDDEFDSVEKSLGSHMVTLKLGKKYTNKILRIVFDSDDKVTTYECNIDNKDINLKLVFQKEILDNRNIYTCKLNSMYRLFQLKNMDYEFKLFIRCSKVEFFDDTKMLELDSYLRTLELPISFVDVYKRICEEYLGDVSKYSEIFIAIDKRIGDKTKTISFIDLICGELESFVIERNCEIVTGDRYGNWSFKNRLVDYNNEIEEKVNKMGVNLYKRNVARAKRAADEVKKLIRIKKDEEYEDV